MFHAHHSWQVWQSISVGGVWSHWPHDLASDIIWDLDVASAEAVARKKAIDGFHGSPLGESWCWSGVSNVNKAIFRISLDGYQGFAVAAWADGFVTLFVGVLITL